MTAEFDPHSDDVLIFILQAVLILITTRLLAVLFRKYLREPMVIAEIIGGILLGQSGLGQINGYLAYVFSPTPQASPILSVMANIGLLFFMFIIGLELSTDHFQGHNVRQFVLIAVASVGLPLGLGLALADYFHQFNPSVQFSTFILFFGVSMCITAFPVLCRILAEANLTQSKVGMIALSAAAVNDVIGWIILAVAVSFARATSKLAALWTFLLALGYILFISTVVRLGFLRLSRNMTSEEDITPTFVLCVIVTMLIGAWITDIIGIHSLFGAFTIGVVMPKTTTIMRGLTEKLESVIVLFMLPLYFVYSGLRVDLTLLRNGSVWGGAALIFVVAMGGKVVGAGLMARLTGLDNRESLAMGILMNTRGLMELIVLNLGLDLGVLTSELFTMLVIMAVATTMLTAPLMRLVYSYAFVKQSEDAHIELAELEEGGNKSDGNILISISNRITGRDMVELVQPLVKHGNPVIALRLVALSNMPSSYMYSQERMAQMDPAMAAVETRARDLEVPLRPLIVQSLNTEDDMVATIESQHVDMVFLAWNEPIFSSGGVESDETIRSVLARVTAGVAVFVDRQNFASVLRRIFVPYVGDLKCLHGCECLRFARRYAKSEGLQVVLLELILPGSDASRGRSSNAGGERASASLVIGSGASGASGASSAAAAAAAAEAAGGAIAATGAGAPPAAAATRGGHGTHHHHQHGAVTAQGVTISVPRVEPRPWTGAMPAEEVGGQIQPASNPSEIIHVPTLTRAEAIPEDSNQSSGIGAGSSGGSGIAAGNGGGSGIAAGNGGGSGIGGGSSGIGGGSSFDKSGFANPTRSSTSSGKDSKETLLLRRCERAQLVCDNVVTGIRKYAAGGFQLAILAADHFDRATVLDPLVENCASSLLIVYEKGEMVEKPVNDPVHFFPPALQRRVSRVLPATAAAAAAGEQESE